MTFPRSSTISVPCVFIRQDSRKGNDRKKRDGPPDIQGGGIVGWPVSPALRQSRNGRSAKPDLGGGSGFLKPREPPLQAAGACTVRSRRSRRHKAGLFPVASRNLLQKWDWSENPQLIAISLSGSSPVSIICSAAARRRRVMNR